LEHARTFRRLGDAEAWLEEERTNARRGGWIDPTRGKEPLGSFYDRWKQLAAETGRPSERTLIAYDELWRLYIAPKLKDESLNAITRADVEQVVCAAAKRSAWRANDALKVLRRLLSAAVDAEAIARNPATRVPTPRIEQERPWVLTMDEVDALAEAVPDRYRALVLLAAYGSLRWSELVALRVDRLSPSRDRVRVVEKIVESGRLIRGEPKTKRSRRWVTVPDFVASALADHVKEVPVRSRRTRIHRTAGRADPASGLLQARLVKGDSSGRTRGLPVPQPAPHGGNAGPAGGHEPGPGRVPSGACIDSHDRATLRGAR
jgi:integrase